MKPPIQTGWWDAVLLGAVFFILAYFSLTFAREAGQVAAVWPANAFLVVAILRFPRVGGRARLFAAWIGNVAADLLMGDAVPTALYLSALNVGEASICAYVMTRFIGEKIDFTRSRDLVVFATSALVAPLVSGALAAGYLSWSQSRAFLSNLLIWWPTNALGLLIFTPALFIVVDPASRRSIRPISPRRAALLVSALAAGLSVVFLQRRLPLTFIIPPILGWITFELGVAGAAWGVLAITVFSMTALFMGNGPTMMAGSDLNPRVGLLQFFLAFLAFTSFPLASVLGVRGRLETSLEHARKLAEETTRQLKEAVEVASQAEQIAGMGYWLYHPRTREVSWSDGMYQIYGLHNDGRVPDFESVVALFHPEDQAEIRDNALRSLRTGDTYELQLRVVRGDDTRWVIASTRCQFDDVGAITVLIGTMIDVTGLRRTEAALIDSEVRYRTLADSVPDLILRQSPQGTVTFASAASRLYGYEPEDIVGRSIFDFIHPDDAADALKRYQSNFSSADIDISVRREQRLRTADGAWVWLEGNPVQVRDDAGEVIEVVNALRDVTRRRALEDELLQARFVAEQANQAKSEFLANMSHELRTPLTAIVGFAELLKHTGKLGESETMFVGRIATASAALHGLVNDILDFSKMEAGGVHLETMPVVLDDLIDESLSMVTAAAGDKRLAISAKIEGDIKTFTGDPTRLRQVLVNLLSNAVKFTDKGSVRLKVSPTGAGRIRFEVSDTGAGIPPDRLDRIFDRFTQADGSTTRSHGGTGLGLAICKGLVEAMGGQISVESRVGVGSTFSFVIVGSTTPDKEGARTV